jgi:valyl-tRNA synthetase
VAQKSDRYQRAAVNLGLIFVLIVLLKVVYAVVSEINSLLLLAPLFKLIGFGYSTWFASKNLLWAEKRRVLADQLQAVTAEAFGQFEEVVDSIVEPDAPSDRLVAPSSAPLDEKMIAGVVGTVQVLIPLAGVVDIEAMRSKLQRDLNKVEAEITSLSQRLGNSKFVDKAPADVVQGARDALTEAEKQAEILRDRLVAL